MKLFKKLLSFSLIYKILFKLTYALYIFNKDYDQISDVIYTNDFYNLMYQYLGVSLKKDWIGRLYGVVNPNIIDGKVDFRNTIIELDDDRTSNDEYLKHWIYKQLLLVSQLFKFDRLYDYLTLEIKHVGPINADNYLLIFDISSRKELFNIIKGILIQLIIYIIIGLIVFMLI